MEITFSDSFVKSLKKYDSIKKSIKKKVDMIISSPVSPGEPLKGNFRGYYSCPVHRNFLIIYLYCNICRKKGDDGIVLCSDCDISSDETIKFIALGPHDQVYGKK
ncbi:MAG: type II toxin-antitoxin system mRNA interferase toxin, RelE/StbE family [Candidatus Eremiobacterota bacterium]|mgnify:CR=1 FL=1